MSVKTVTFGCRLNTCESAMIQGFNGLPENMIVVNSCAVTGEAERQCRQEIRKLRRAHPDAFLIVTGCAAQLFPEKYASMPEVDKVLGNREKLCPENYIRDGVKILTGSPDMLNTENAVSPVCFDGRIRAFMQIQQGCNHFCTFCIIPKARGKSFCLPADIIISQAQRLIDAGYVEISLTGVDISAYPDLHVLTHRLLKETHGLKRLRFGSIDPACVSDELISLFGQSDILQPHVHFSVQSGDDMILKRMRRRHRREKILQLCEKFRKVRPDIVFGADFIAGFPTETDDMFYNTVSLVKQARLTHLHVFPYSERTGTPASLMPQVPVAVRKERARLLRLTAQEVLFQYMQSRLGTNAIVLCENDAKGMCEHYLPVQINGKASMGDFVNVKLTKIIETGLFEGTPTT